MLDKRAVADAASKELAKAQTALADAQQNAADAPARLAAAKARLRSARDTNTHAQALDYKGTDTPNITDAEFAYLNPYIQRLHSAVDAAQQADEALSKKKATYDDAKAKADQADSDKLAAEVNLHMLKQAAEKEATPQTQPTKDSQSKEVKAKKKAGKKSERKKNAQILPETGDAGALGIGAATLLGTAFVGASAVRTYKAKHFRD